MMTIESYGRFTSYDPGHEPGHPFHGQNISHLRNERGQDWYDVATALAADVGMTFSVDDGGRVVEADMVADKLHPIDRTVYHMRGSKRTPDSLRRKVFNSATGKFK